MLYLLGVGAAVPETIIDNSLLKELNPDLDVASAEAQFGIHSRRSALSVEYLKQSHGKSASAGMVAGLQSPTDLAYSSALTALSVAEVEKELLGLVIGDCSSPVQTCPSEGQRLGCKLGIKVPAYDITTASGSFVVQLSTLNKWKEEKVPEYVLGMTSCTTTHTIDYSKGQAGFFFGDGAASWVVSSRKAGKLALLDAGFVVEPKHSRDIKIETFGHLQIPESYIAEFVRPNVAECLNGLKAKYGAEFATSKFIGPQSDVLGSAAAAVAAGYSEKNVLSNGRNVGDMLGASQAAVLANEWNTFRKGEKIFVVQSGLGISHGYLVFEVME